MSNTVTENNIPASGWDRFKADFLRRCRENKPTRWVRFGCVSLVFLLFVIWLGNPWVLLVWPLLFDIYITGYIPFTFWKRSRNRAVRTVGSWVDAIIYALILVYFIFAFVGQNYSIPSSSLEKTLLTGDYLVVNKMVYGPRVPQTPLHFPLADNTMPLVGGKSYISSPQLDYHRLPGVRDIERFDIVVFNAPCADTVPQLVPEPDYYHLVQSLEEQGVRDARAYIRDNKAQFGELLVHPVDRRTAFVKRTIGLPGDRLKIVGDIVYINGKPLPEPEHVQHNYIVPVSSEISSEQWEQLGVSKADQHQMQTAIEFPTPFYDVPLTNAMLKQIKELPQISGEIKRRTDLMMPYTDGIFPLWGNLGWSLDNLGEFWIPRQGSTLHLTLQNLPVYRRAIETYEGNTVEVKDGKILINGEPTEYYTFKMDYYWMMGDNRDNSSDSRFWGFVPEDHIIGSPLLVLISFDSDRPFPSNIRWNRILTTPNPDKR